MIELSNTQESKMLTFLEIFKGSIMKKLILMCLVIATMFANVESTSKNPFDKIAPLDKIRAGSDNIIYQWEDEPLPSFDCDKDTNTAETLICFGRWRYNAVLDNFYTSYYHIIMQNIPDDKKATIKKIAKEMIKERNNEVEQADEEIQKYNNEMYTDEERVGKRSGLQLSWEESIGDIISAHYKSAIMEFTRFILQYDPHLFMQIFHTHTEEYKIIFQDKEIEYYDVLGALYLDNLIDKTGKLIVKVDSK
ncbi:hypothetical protein HRAG_02273 [Helicobacter bilis ATCC 43879]|uniref:Uncharacterized protein n=3 Tax=Helicobacteraceae TaxID=72293 RepID=T5LPU5_9HELI|nr:hypothetical protein HRAG_02273 [Helicobacter bilis ATCC 43879]